jgi:Domain of unknown function (DUF4836)
MKKSLVILASAALMLTVLFTACKSKKTNTVGRYVPENAGFVLHINGESLISKLSWDDIKKNEWFNKIYSDTSNSALAKSLLDNPENSGINIKSDIVMFGQKDSTGSFNSIIGTITDEAKFKKLLAEANKGATETSQNGYTYSTSSKASVAYNKDRFVATMNNQEKNSFGLDDSLTTNTPVDLKAVNAKILALDEDKSLAKSDKFSKLVTEKGDAHFWFNAQTINKNNAAMPMLVNIDKLTEGAITAGTINFENGKIAIDMKSYAGKELSSLYKKYNSNNINKEMVSNIPSKNIAGLLTFSFKPEGIKELLKLLSLDGVATLGLSKYGFTLDDFIKANNGDILIAITDLNKDAANASGKANFVFATSINDKASFNKLIDAGKKLGGGLSMMVPESDKISFNTNDKFFILSNNKTTTDTYLAGTAKSNYDFLSKLENGPVGGYANLQYIISNIPIDSDSLEIKSQALNLKTWDNIVLSGGKFADDALNQHVEINLIDKNTNSLKQLNSYSNEMSIIQKSKNELNNSKWENEDIIAPTLKQK